MSSSQKRSSDPIVSVMGEHDGLYADFGNFHLRESAEILDYFMALRVLANAARALSSSLPDGSYSILGSPIVRLSLSGQVVNSGAAGMVELDLDLTSLPQGTVFQPGDTWYFQFWFRDSTTSNTSDGIEVMFE